MRRLYGEPWGCPVWKDDETGRFYLRDDAGQEHGFDDYPAACEFVARQWVLRLLGGTRH